MSQCQDRTVPGLVSFVGAGPGALDLLTLRGAKAIEEADLVLYAGSLVSEDVSSLAKPGAKIVNSAPLTLAETHSLIRTTAKQGGLTARVHTGDPSLFGAVAEQIALLDVDAIPWRIIPGVTAAMAAAAAAGISFSLPTRAQSLIFTRLDGRTKMPANENLAELASHGINLAIYLAGQQPEKLQFELAKVLAPETCVICASRISWPDEQIIRTTLAELAICVRQHALGRQTLFLILPAYGGEIIPSRLYSANFRHQFRNAGN